MTITTVHPAVKGANKYLNSLCRWFLAAVWIGESERSSLSSRETVVSTQSPQFGRVFNLTLHMSL